METNFTLGLSGEKSTLSYLVGEKSMWIKGKPEEHDSLFMKFYGTDKWKPGYFKRMSDHVLVTIEFKGERFTDVAFTVDGDWDCSFLRVHKDAKVISFMYFPQPDME